jgi:Zn-dependent protease with chaperone function
LSLSGEPLSGEPLSLEHLSVSGPPAPSSERIISRGRTRLEIAAWYYDPRSSRPTDVRLITDGDERMIVSGPGVDVECAVRGLRVSAPMLGNTLDAIVLPNGAQCETADKEAVERLRELTERPVPFARIHRWESSWPVSLAAVACVVALIAIGYFWAIPIGAARLARSWPALAQRIGRGTLTLLDTALEPTKLSKREQRQLHALFARAAADYPALSLDLELRKAGFANAFALPDGTVVLTDEIVRLSTHDGALEGVVFHEIGHVVHGHGLRRALESSAFAFIAAAYYGDAERVSALGGGLPLAYAQSRYSRDEETEADDVALDGLIRHQLDPRHYARLLRALESESGPSRPELRYFSSHPATQERVRRFERAGNEGL